MKTKEETLTLLVALGNTAKEVADSLACLGINGDKKKCKTCPIAQYLIKNEVGNGVSLWGHNFLGVEVKLSSYYWYPISEHIQLTGVRDFILAFDRGEYPQCEMRTEP